MRRYPHALLSVMLMLSCSCAHQTSVNHQELAPLPEYRLMLTAYDGPSMGAGFSGWVVMEVDLPNSRMRLLKKRVDLKHFSGGIPPDVPPYDSESLAKAIRDIPWMSLPNREVTTLNKLIHAWLETSPPAKYELTRGDFGWPGHTTITVQSPRRTVISEMACQYRRLPYADETGELRELLSKLSYIEILWDRGAQPMAEGDGEPAPEP